MQQIMKVQSMCLGSCGYLNNAVHKAAVYLGVVGLVHELGAQHVEGRHRARHEKAGREGGAEVGGDSLRDDF